MGFGDRVKELLEAYSKCLKHLRAHRRKQKAPPDAGQSVSDLYRSLESDRAQVRERYSTRLSETGSRLAKGDGDARRALRRISRRLLDALGGLLDSRSKSVGGPRPDYGSLCSLSNTSRIRAIETIDALSARLDRAASAGGHAGVSADERRRTLKQKKRRKATETQQARPEKKLRSNKPRRVETGSAARKEAAGKPQKDRHRQGREARGSTLSRASGRHDKRISRRSSSSDSTKLGLIPEHKWPQSHETWDSEGEQYYNVRPTYPLRPFHTSPARTERRRGFWGFLRRSQPVSGG